MIKQNPFSLYDFLGYLIPGSLLSYFILLFTKRNEINSFNELINVVSKNNEFQLDKILFFIIVSYCLGHLISYFSSITIERYAYWKYDYPSKYLLGLNEEQKYFIKNIGWKLTFFRIILAILLLPIVTFDLILGEYFNFKFFYTKKLDDFLIRVIKSKNLALLDKLYPPDYQQLRKKDFHRIISHYVYENSKNHQFRLTNYVAIYGFLRAISLISTFVFWAFLLYSLKKSVLLILNHNILVIDWYSIIILTLIALITYVYFMAFMKFYRRYTLEAYMLVAIDESIDSSKYDKTEEK